MTFPNLSPAPLQLRSGEPQASSLSIYIYIYPQTLCLAAGLVRVSPSDAFKAARLQSLQWDDENVSWMCSCWTSFWKKMRRWRLRNQQKPAVFSRFGRRRDIGFARVCIYSVNCHQPQNDQNNSPKTTKTWRYQSWKIGDVSRFPTNGNTHHYFSRMALFNFLWVTLYVFVYSIYSDSA